MRRSQLNLERAAGWALADTQAFAGVPAAAGPNVTVAQIAAITRREILDVPSAPMILYMADVSVGLGLLVAEVIRIARAGFKQVQKG